MTAQERQTNILKVMAQCDGMIKLKDIASRFGVSNETARRDLESLQDKKLIVRIAGGAMLQDQRQIRLLPPINASMRSGVDKRAAIGKAAAALIHEGERIILGAGSTAVQVARHMKNLRNLTVLTDSLTVAMELLDTDFEIYVLGGKLDTNELCLSGAMGISALRRVFVDKVIIGAGGISFTHGISEHDTQSADIHTEMVSRGRHVILVAQSDKFGRDSFSIDLNLRDINTIVSDIELADEYANGLRDLGIELILADPSEEDPGV